MILDSCQSIEVALGRIEVVRGQEGRLFGASAMDGP
jgi:hypothetical protein